MPPSHARLRILLLQVRTLPAIIAEEQASFCARARLAPEQLLPVNALEAPLHEGLLDGVDAVLIGGAGAYSVTETYSWTDDLVALCRACAARRLPLFGSCWGHQFIARAFGGLVVNDPARAEMGTHAVTLTAQGAEDPIFGRFPRRFRAQMGHHDRVARLPEAGVELARNRTAPFQAFRLRGLPVYGTQFHSELDRRAVHDRLVAYRAHYPELADDDAFQAVVDGLHETLDADDLLFHFLRRYAVEGVDEPLACRPLDVDAGRQPRPIEREPVRLAL